jgi:outer membrane protein assembly factor BamB
MTDRDDLEERLRSYLRRRGTATVPPFMTRPPRRRRPLLGAVAAVAVAVCVGGAFAGVILVGRHPSAGASAPVLGSCSLSAGGPPPGVTPSLEPVPQGAVGPAWSGQVGQPREVEGTTAFGTDGTCIVAVGVVTGQIEWSAAPPAGHPDLFGLTADASTVLVATGVTVGQAPALEFPVVNELVAYDSATGQPRWAVALPDDGQGLPAVLTGGVVVVSGADGSLLGLSESDGHQLWSDPAPAGCTTGGSTTGVAEAAVVGAAPAGQGALALVADGCPGGGSVVAVDASTGITRWTWPAPRGWTVDVQEAAAVSTGSSAEFAVTAPISLLPSANAPASVAPAPAPALSTAIGNAYQVSGSSDVVVLDGATGGVRWDLAGVVGQGIVAVGGDGILCVLTDAGADCRSAQDGTRAWSTTWPGSNASADAPALSCVDRVMQSCVASAGGVLYLALATASTPAYPPEWTPTTPYGSFVLTALSLANGRRVLAIPLPAFSVQSDHAVSLALPPAVLAAGGGMVLVSPQFEETGLVEAFAEPGAG